MRFIENNELREWVKDSLRKTIFQKAHALAVQTGCEVLVKLQDVTDAAGCQYFATSTLQQAYKISNLRQPGEMAVSGETGMPMFPMVDRAIQIGDDSNTGFASSLAAEGDGDDGDGGGQGELNGDGQTTPVPMQLSMAGSEQGTEQRTHSEQGSQPPTPSEHQQAAGMGLGMHIKSEPGSDLMDLIGLIPGSGDGGAMNVKQEPPGGEDKSSDGTLSYGDSDDIIDVTPAQQAAQQAAQQMQMMFNQQQQQAAAAAAAQSMAGPMGSPTTTSPFGASAQLQAFSSSVPAAQGSPTGAAQRYPVPMAPKPYQCATCQKAFGSIQLLQKHTQTFHMRAQNVMSQKTRGRGRGSRGNRGGGQRTAMSWQQRASPTQSPNRFPAPAQQGQFSPQQQQWLEQAATSPTHMPQIAQVQTLQSPGSSPAGTSSPYGQHSPGSFPSPGAGPSTASPQARRQLIGSSPSRGKATTRHRNVGKRFALATARGIMSGVLLTPGPVATHKALKNLSMAFNVAVTKAKFVSACNRLQGANLGFLTTVENKNRQAEVFVKRQPEEVQMFLQPGGENADLASFEEYSQRFGLPPSAAVTPPIKQNLIQMGMVRPEHFKEKGN